MALNTWQFILKNWFGHNTPRAQILKAIDEATSKEKDLDLQMEKGNIYIPYKLLAETKQVIVDNKVDTINDLRDWVNNKKSKL